MMPVTLLFLALMRAHPFRAGFKHAHSATLDNFPEANVVRVTIPRSGSFHFRGGQYVFLCVPELSLFEWHPFSISVKRAECCCVLRLYMLRTLLSLSMCLFFFNVKWLCA